MTEPLDVSADAPTSDEELRELTDSIAQSLASLSEEGDVPIGCDAPTEQFSPEDVRFTSSAWLLSVCHVQGWLNLNDSLDRTTVLNAPSEAAEQLFEAMNCANPAECYCSDGDNLRLTLHGATQLNTRLSTAERLRDVFREQREELTRRDATNIWQEAWEEEDGTLNSGESLEQIKARTSVWRITDVAARAKQGRLNLNPSYQRGDVWPNSDAQKLIESVLRGIPLPSIVILKPKSHSAAAKYEVVDGKQRLTAILRFSGQHPDALRRVEEAHARFPDLNLREHFQQNYRKFKKLWKAHLGENLTAELERTYYFPFPLRRNADIFKGYLAPYGGKYFCELRQDEIYVGDEREFIGDVFTAPSQYNLLIIEYLDATARQIHTVFNLYNKQGKHLNAEELRNAVHHELDLTRVLLAASGDNTDYASVVGFLENGLWNTMGDIARTLRDYKVGVQRFKRTKVLSWIISLLIQPSLEDEKLATRSTARHINMLLEAIEDSDGTHPLCDRGRLKALIEDLGKAVATHSAFDGWHDRFKDNESGTKWQELQLVASVVAVFLLNVCRENADTLLEEKRDEVLRFTGDHLRPTKTQNKEQWGFIGSCVMGLLQMFEIADDEIDEGMKQRYGRSPLATLKAAAASYQPRR
jgi:hypothetical protein